MEHRTVIHGSYLGGYGLPGMLAFVGVLGAIAALGSQIWARRSALVVWLVVFGGAVITIFVLELISRRNFVEVDGGRIRWFFRQPPEQGDEPLASLQKVEVFPSAVRVVFMDGGFVAGRDDFRRSDLNRLVETLRDLGAHVSGTAVKRWPF